MQRIARAVRVSGFLLACAVFGGGASAAPVLMKLEGVGPPGTAGASGEIEIQSFHWGPRQTTSADGARTRTGNQVMMDDRDGREKLQPGGGGANQAAAIGGGRTGGDPDRPVIAGSVPDTTASKRQHGAVTITKEWDAATPRLARPLARGSVWIRMATPWTACRAGARFTGIALVDGAARYQLGDVVVTGCAVGGASLDYAKVTVRGWDPAKKEE